MRVSSESSRTHSPGFTQTSCGPLINKPTCCQNYRCEVFNPAELLGPAHRQSSCCGLAIGGRFHRVSRTNPAWSCQKWRSWDEKQTRQQLVVSPPHTHTLALPLSPTKENTNTLSVLAASCGLVPQHTTIQNFCFQNTLEKTEMSKTSVCLTVRSKPTHSHTHVAVLAHHRLALYLPLVTFNPHFSFHAAAAQLLRESEQVNNAFHFNITLLWQNKKHCCHL